jgi:ubiquinone/menaquinone biosynthesis C-methylase UbiE
MTEIDPSAFRDFERSTHDRIAGSYEAFFTPITAHAATPLLEAVQAAAGFRVLDVATGPGVVAAHAARRGAHVTGIDISPRMVALAAQLNPGCSFREADVESLPFAPDSFDAVVCAFGIGHFPSAEAALRECARVMSPGARLAVAWWDVPARSRLQGVMLEAIQEVGVRPPPSLPAGPALFQYSEDAALAQLLGAAGLTDVIVTTHAFVHRVASTQVLWDGALGSLARVSAVIHLQAPDVTQRIRDAFERRASPYAGEGGITIPMSFKVAVGRQPQSSDSES